jgi:iron complex outermembrane receptor protein
MEELNVVIHNNFGEQQIFSIADRDYTQKIWSGAGYVTASFDFWEDFTLDGGGRYNYDRKSIDYQLLRGGGAPLEDFREDDWSEPTGTVRLTYRFREDTHVYWKYTRGWKGGHYNATSSLNKGVTLATPETIDAFETGIRGSWFDGMANMSVNLFYYDYQDYQLFTAEDSFNGQPEFVILNANDARVYGAELDVKLFPHPTLFLNVNVSWLESEFLDFVQVQLARRVVGTQAIPINKEIQNSGNRLLNSPEWKVSLTAEQTLPLGRFGALVGRYDGAWTDDSYYDATEGRGIANNQDQIFLPEDTIGQRAFWLHNVSLRYVDPTTTVEVTGWCRNLTNETYKTFAFDGTSFRETTIYYTADPRTYGITVGVRF